MPQYRIRLPYEDLPAVMRAQSDRQVAEQLGLSSRTVIRWRLEGGVPLHTADRVAAMLGMHPNDIWGSGFDEAWTDWEELLAASRDARLTRNRERQQAKRDDAAGLAYVLRRLHESWWDADARRVLEQEWAA